MQITSVDTARKRRDRLSINVSELLAWIGASSADQQRDEFGRSSLPRQFRNGPLRTPETKLTEIISFMSSGWWSFPFGGRGGTISYNNGIATISQTLHDLDSARRLIGLMQHVSARPARPLVWYLEERGFAAPTTRRVQSQMQRTVKLAAVDAPLADVINKLSRDSGLHIRTDWIALEESGVLRDEPVTINSEASLQSVMRNVLTEFGLVALPRDNGLFVTTASIAHEIRVTAFFDVRDLTTKGIPGASLVTTIMQEAKGQWEDTDPGGSILEIGGLLFVRQSLSSLADVELLLRDLRNASSPRRKKLAESIYATEVTRFYSVNENSDAQKVLTAIKTFVYPDRWNSITRQGDTIAVGQALIIRRTPDVHVAIATFLENLNSRESAR